MSISSSIGRGVVALGVLAAVSSTAHADRRTGLAANLLIEDKDDVYFFPHLTSTYRNMISLDYGGTETAGNAILTLGNADMAYGVALHRGDVLDPTAVGVAPQLIARNSEINALNAPASAFPDIPAAPATIVDFLLATGNIGFRAAIGRGVDNMTDPGTGETTGSDNTFLMGEFGWGNGAVRGQDTRIDVGASLLLNFGGAQAAGEDTFSGTNIGVNGLIRAYLPQDEQLDLGILGVVGVNSLSESDEVADDSASNLSFKLGGGVGPAFRFGAAQVAAYATLRFGYSTFDPSSEGEDDESGTMNIIIPGVNMATEIPLNDWFVVRTGAQYEWNINDVSGPGDGGSGTQAGSFGWNAGLGVIIDQFRFDGALQQGFLLGGPDFIGGTAPGFFAIASLTYSFDAARSGEVTPTGEPEPEEPVAEEPPPPALQPAPPPGDVPPPAPAPAAQPENPETGATGTGAVGGSAGGSISIGGGTR